MQKEEITVHFESVLLLPLNQRNYFVFHVCFLVTCKVFLSRFVTFVLVHFSRFGFVASVGVYWMFFSGHSRSYPALSSKVFFSFKIKISKSAKISTKIWKKIKKNKITKINKKSVLYIFSCFSFIYIVKIFWLRKSAIWKFI